MPTQAEFNATPTQLEELFSPAWLTQALSATYPGVEVVGIQIVETLRTTASKIRFTVEYAKPQPGVPTAFCVKGFFDSDLTKSQAASVGVKEADFYTKIAPQLPIRLPRCVYAGVDRQAMLGVFIMEDLIAQGARFFSALDPVNVDQVAGTLEQLARLHASHAAPEALDRLAWIGQGVLQMDPTVYVPTAELQTMLDGPRGVGLSDRVRNAVTLQRGLVALAEANRGWRQFLVHGDAHAGNLFMTADGPGVIDWQCYQRATWALDVVYHINAILTVELAEQNERRLLAHYLEALSAEGVETPSFDEAFEQYRFAAIYGYFMWGITRRVDPAIINVFVNRLGSAVGRHQSFELAGV
jgi:hypothetical protein